MFGLQTGKVILAVLALGLASPGAALACERPDDAATWEKALFNWVNSERRAIGLAPFRHNGKLKAAALRHACDMAEHGYFAHARSGGPSLKERVKGAGYNLKSASENIAYTRQPDPGTAAEIWRNSSVHWGSMTSASYSDAAVAIATGGGKIYWVMDMGRLK